METMDQNCVTAGNEKRVKDGRGAKSFFPGLILVTVGTLLLLWKLDIAGAVLSWKSVMMVIGIMLIAGKRYTAGWIVGGIGLFFMIFSLPDDRIASLLFAPAVLIVIGCVIIVKRIARGN